MSTRDYDVRAILRRLHGRGDGSAPTGPEAKDIAQLWQELPDPGPLAPPPGFAGTVLRRLDGDQATVGISSLLQAPSPVRFAAAFGLAAGVALGVGCATLLPPAVTSSSVEQIEASVSSGDDDWVVGTTLAESWLSLSEEGS